MFNRKLLLISLLTVMSWLGAMAQNANVYGIVSNENGGPENGVNILVTVFFADSSAAFYSEYTDSTGYYSVDIPTSEPNFLGFVEVTMVDCQGTTQSQFFTIFNGNEVFEANFIYCQGIEPDSCTLFILEEWNPGNNIQLTAWIPPGLTADFSWTTGETTQTIIPPVSGSYCVTATFDSGCVLIDCITVWIDSTSCFAYIVTTDNGDGTFDLLAVPAFGQYPFTYEWSTGETTETLENVPEGTYCVVSTDSLGCQYTACVIVEAVQFCEVYIYEEPSGGLFAEGFGTPPATYIWNTGESGQSIYPNAPGIYCVTMTDATGCVASSCYDYGWSADSCSVYISAFVSDSNEFALQVYGYTSADSWTFLWSTGETEEIIYPDDPTQTYCVTMTDSDGCQSYGCYESYNWCYTWIYLEFIDTTTATLEAYTDPIFNLPGNDSADFLWSTGDTTQTITVHEDGIYCVTVTIGADCINETCVQVDFDSLSTACSSYVFQYPDSSGVWFAEAYAWGPGTFSYNWSNGDTNQVTQIEDPNVQTCVTVTSTFGCESVACTDTFFLPCEAVISINYLSNQAAVLTASLWNDPAQNATFTWSNGETGPVITVNQEGTYCVTVMAGGCVKTTCIDVYFWNVDSCGVWISEDPSSGSGILYIANAWGTPPFQYQWSNGDTNDSTFIDFGIHDLCVTVTDATGCVSSGCNYKFDSCYVELYYTDNPVPSIQIYSSDPIAWVTWSTGDSLPWLEITEPGTYCATVTTIFGCVNTACITVDTLVPTEGLNYIAGYVFGDTLSGLVGTVYAFLVDPNTGSPYVLVDSARIEPYGFYKFPGLPDGLYLLKAITENSPNQVAYIPTYHLSSTTWEGATPHQLPNWLTVTTDIYMKKTIGLNGGGVIGGFVTDPQHLFAGEDADPRGLAGLGNVEVILKDAQGQPLQFAWTLPDGGFRFPGLPWGTYRISYDIPGLNSPDIWVTISEETPERLNITLIVNQGTTEVEEPVAEEIKLYPNPTNHEVNIPLSGAHARVDVQVMDMQGKLVYAGSVRNTNGVFTVDVTTFSPGLYHINLSSEQGRYYGRFIKQD